MAYIWGVIGSKWEALKVREKKLRSISTSCRPSSMHGRWAGKSSSDAQLKARTASATRRGRFAEGFAAVAGDIGEAGSGVPPVASARVKRPKQPSPAMRPQLKAVPRFRRPVEVTIRTVESITNAKSAGLQPSKYSTIGRRWV